MHTHSASLSTRTRKPGWWLLALCLVVATALLPSGAGRPAQAAPPRQEATSDRLPLDGIFDLPRWEGSAVLQNAASAAMAPEYASWSKLVFQSARNERDWEIFAAHGDGSNQVNLSNHGSMDIHPRLNRGAARVVFASNRRDDNFEIYAMGADGSDQTRLTNNDRDDVYPAWSPDGGKVALQSYRDGQPEVYVMNADGSNQRRLTNHGDYDGQPAWSPDGSQIAFVRQQSGQMRVWMMNADGSNQRQLSNQAASENPAWSPDGTQIAYDSDGDGDGWQEIWLMNADGSNQRQVYKPGEYQTDAWMRSWSPNGRYVAFTRIAFIQQEGNWYWTAAYLDAADPVRPWEIIRLSDNGADWYPDWQSTDVHAPTSSMQPLAAESPASFTVHWSGADTGGAGLRSYDVQVRDGAGGSWTNWQSNTTDTSASYSGVGGHAYFFRTRARDNANNLEAWPASHDAVTTVEAIAPQTAVCALSAYSRNGLLIRWSGNDPGGSGIVSYDVQYRREDGAWTNWRMGVTETSATFTGTPGVQYRFRVRARDLAQNLEPWPPSADATTMLYTWAIAGQATDNRRAPVVGMMTWTAPPTFHMIHSDGEGAYTALVSPEATAYTAVWGKTGYGALPTTAFPPELDASVDVVLPPADNVVQNWGFENGNASWQFGGALPATLTTVETHTGASAAFLGSSVHPLSAISPLRGPLYNWSPGVDAAVDTQGVLHSIWADMDGRIMYSRKPFGDAWTNPAPLPGPAAVAGSAFDLQADNRGSVHLVWVTAGGLYYVHNRGGAGWSRAEIIPGTEWSGVAPALAVSRSGTVKVIFTGPGYPYNDAYFTERQPNGAWSPLRKIAETYGIDDQFQVATDPSGLAHLLWNGGDTSGYADFLYAAERSDGSWTEPVNLSQYDSHPGDADMVVDALGAVHVLWSTDGIYYQMRAPGGSWTTRVMLAPAEGGGVSLALDDQGRLHGVWGDRLQNQVRYAQHANGSWSPPLGVAPPTASSSQSAPQIMSDSNGQPRVLWLQYEDLNNWSIRYAAQDLNGDWFPQVTVFENDHDTGRPYLLLDHSGTPHAVWHAFEDGSYLALRAGPAPAQATGEAYMSQSIQAPAAALAPTLSFIHRFATEFPSSSRLEAVVDDGISSTVVFSATTGSNIWTHQWADLTPWTGRSFTLRFRVVEEAGGSHAGAYIDEVTVGSAHPDIWVNQPGRRAVRPGQQMTLTIIYGNRGGVAASGGQVALQLPTELTLVSADPPPAAIAPSLRWDVGALAAQNRPQTIRVTLQVAASAVRGATLNTAAAITSGAAEIEQANNTAAASILVGSLSYLPVNMH